MAKNAEIKRERRARFAKKLAVCAAVLGGYYIFVRLTGLSLPCFFQTVTGLRCPGCGITHMLLSAAELDFAAAFAYNQALFILLPIMGALAVIKLIFAPDWLEANSRALDHLVLIALIALMIFGVLRNIPAIGL
ncbi:DUF2752 domain-containing protein [Ruminococcus sp. 210702-SL.1.03]|uniref:DUF2752 domain-containing protein n=1 Tax=Ruminococcus sp. 210702-SL.1.03 TaxID=2883233 RepID=UPI001D0675D5|nr:DUF2752 domain-containing protein [Ruminococcus sp. 210702-SL.1.03]MCB6615758.1 DUF2752 domain-containing protein [Ruminococcus sp. 210702-SL.1.03]